MCVSATYRLLMRKQRFSYPRAACIVVPTTGACVLFSRIRKPLISGKFAVRAPQSHVDQRNHRDALPCACCTVIRLIVSRSSGCHPLPPPPFPRRINCPFRQVLARALTSTFSFLHPHPQPCSWGCCNIFLAISQNVAL